MPLPLWSYSVPRLLSWWTELSLAKFSYAEHNLWPRIDLSRWKAFRVGDKAEGMRTSRLKRYGSWKLEYRGKPVLLVARIVSSAHDCKRVPTWGSCTEATCWVAGHILKHLPRQKFDPPGLSFLQRLYLSFYPL